MSKKFKVGDIVKAIDNYYDITSLEQHWVGKVDKVNENGSFDAETLKCDYDLKIPHACFKILKPVHFDLATTCNLSIHVTSDGKTTYAVLKDGKKVVKRTEARCHPDDIFEFDVGAYIAINRLLSNLADHLILDEPKKPKFVPHLEFVGYEKTVNYGTIGEPTILVDNKGNELFVGDVVDLYYSKSGEYRGERPVCANDRYTQFVMGIVDNCQPDSPNRKDWVFVKVRSYKDLKHGELIDEIKVVLRED